VCPKLTQLPIIVVAQDHVRPGLVNQLPDPQRIRAAGEGVTCQQQSIASTAEDDSIEKGLEFGGAAMDVADKDGSLVGQALLLFW